MEKSLNRNYRFLLLVIVSSFIWISHSKSLSADDFKEYLSTIKYAEYHYWHKDQKKFIGVTKIEYNETLDNKQRPSILEYSRNYDDEGALFIEKENWFLKKTGELSYYQEKDYRTKMQISDEIKADRIITKLRDNKEKIKLDTKNEKNLVLFETFTLQLQKMVPKIIKKKEIIFNLYIPVLALELKRNRLPLSLSKMEMTASLKKTKERQTIFGRRKTVEIVVQPNLFFLKTILPQDRSEFRLTYLAEYPHYLVIFEEGNIRYFLKKMRTVDGQSWESN